MMKAFSRLALSVAILGCVTRGEAVAEGTKPPQRPNVLFLAVDDIRDWVGCLGGYPSRQWDRVAAAEFDQ